MHCMVINLAVIQRINHSNFSVMVVIIIIQLLYHMCVVYFTKISERRDRFWYILNFFCMSEFPVQLQANDT